MSRRRGWFPDHWDPNVLRYWDGQRWTGRTVSMEDIESGAHHEITRQAQEEAEGRAERQPAGASVSANADAVLHEVFGRRSSPVGNAPRRTEEAPPPEMDEEPTFESLPHNAPIVVERMSLFAVFALAIGVVAVIASSLLWWTGAVPTVIALGCALRATNRINTVKGITGRWAAALGLVLSLTSLAIVAVGGWNELQAAGEARAQATAATVQRPKVLSELVSYVDAQDQFRAARGAYSVDAGPLRDYGFRMATDVVLRIESHPGRYCVAGRTSDGTSWWHMRSAEPESLVEGPCA